ncbi:putative deacetylase complex subunit protein [Rosellinia necatrix]|uniref:Putative deacetylase complex subunit protein n=1 Tax=Rosellinia necatrix TaxID=77044 RepID=A0A1W2TI60_ROSNE|nr:putative deacetylase complex subunit protein [Rosellinia necatrix]
MAALDAGQHLGAGTSKLSRQSPQPQSKRDKKRQVLSDRLSALSEQFNREKDRHYREELQKIQVDVNLVCRVDPYADRPLDEIDRERRERELSQNTNGANNNANTSHRSLLEMAGPTFQEWIRDVEDLLETRDYDMTAQKYDYERKMQDYHNTHAYRIEVAKREHKALSDTLKDRLINNIMSKKYRLTKEKEAIDISDSSALLLHPNQFSLTNPSSPGGTHGKRNTRLRREMEELPGFSDTKKRKRHAGDDDGSPVPARRGDTSNATPFWQSDRLKSLRRGTGPVYSMDKLFTDKELSMTYNTAALASHKHLLTRRDARGNVLPSPEESDTSNGEANEDEEELSAVTMERQPSHTTRSTRGGQQNFYDDKILGLEGLANFELAGNLSKVVAQEPKMPPLIQSHYVKAYVKSESNTPACLSAEDATHDVTVMAIWKNFQTKNGRGSNIDHDNGGRRLLETMSIPQRRSKNVTYVQRPRPSTDALAEAMGVSSSVRDEPVGNPAPANAIANLSAGAPMSRQSSLGGVAMSRAGSGRGKRK